MTIFSRELNLLRMKKILVIIIVALSLQYIHAQKAPNVIVVLADDIGLGDLSFYRAMHADKVVVETPNLDKLAQSGVAFTNAHSPAALCATSRYGIMTGNHCMRSDFPWGVWGAYEKSPIKANQLTLGRMMKKAGYQTAFLGKWHLGGDWNRKDDPDKIYRGPRWKPELDVDIHQSVGGNPQSNGFDYSLTFPAGIQDVPYAVFENSKWLPLADDSEIGYISKEEMLKKDVKLDKSEGLGDTNWDAHDMGSLLVSKAVNYIDASTSENPFFMYYCSQAVHLPHTPPAELNGQKVSGSYATKHMDMIKELDIQMGMMIEALKKKGIYENTVFIFTSDNGGLGFRNTLQAGHQPSDIYRGSKNQIYEGGHRVPFIVAWPKGIKGDKLSAEPVIAIDIMATLIALTGQDELAGKVPDSHNLLPLLKGKKNAKGHDYLIVQGGTGKEVAIIEDGWKLIIQIDKKDKTDKSRKPIALFNLMDNPKENEAQNLINKVEHQELVKAYFEKYNQIRDNS